MYVWGLPSWATSPCLRAFFFLRSRDDASLSPGAMSIRVDVVFVRRDIPGHKSASS